MSKTGYVDYACFELTNYCNLDCAFCNRKEVIGPLKHMNENSLVTMLENIKHHPLKEIKYTGLGEPFLHTKFDKMLEIMNDYFPNANHLVATNAQYDLNSKVGKVFKNSLQYIDMMYFSIDGYKESYERDRKYSSWKKLIKFLDDFSEIDRKGCLVDVNYVVNTDNVYDIPKIEELRQKYDLGELRLNLAQCWDVDDNMKGNERQWGYSEKQIDYLKDNWLDNIRGVSPWTWSDCFWPSRGLYVTVEGDVKGCIIKTDSLSFGNLMETTIEDIHDTDRWKEIKDGCSTDTPNEHCKNCSYKELSPLLSKMGVNNA